MRTTYRRRRERSACDGRGLRLVAVPVVNGDLLDPRRDRAPARSVRSRQVTGEAQTENNTIGCAETGAELLDQCDDLGGLARSWPLGMRWLCPFRCHRHTTSEGRTAQRAHVIYIQIRGMATARQRVTRRHRLVRRGTYSAAAARAPTSWVRGCWRCTTRPAAPAPAPPSGSSAWASARPRSRSTSLRTGRCRARG